MKYETNADDNWDGIVTPIKPLATIRGKLTPTIYPVIVNLFQPLPVIRLLALLGQRLQLLPILPAMVVT